MGDISGPSVTGGRTIGIIMSPTSVRIAQALGLTISTYTAGYTLAHSTLLVPTLLRAPAPLALLQWGEASPVGVTWTSAPALATGRLLAWLASREPNSSTQAFRLYATGAALLASIVPYSYLALADVERELKKREEAMADTPIEEQSLGDSPAYTRSESILRTEHRELSVHQLVDKWGILNLGRAVMVLGGSICATWAVVCNDTSIFELFEMAAPVE